MIDQGYFLTNVFLLVVGTILIRGCFIAVSHRVNISPKLRELFTYIPAAIFPALVMPAAFFHHGRVEALAGKERFLILLFMALICYFKRNTLFIIGLGLGLLYLANFLGQA